MSNRELFEGEDLHEFFGNDPDSYNIDLDTEATGREAPDGSGRPGIGLASAAIAFWAGQQDAYGTIADAARVFAMPPEAVVQAVRVHPFLYLGGGSDTALADRTIEPDGE